jgi:hypothetical protein
VSPSSNPEFRPRDVIMVFVALPLTFFLVAVLILFMQGVWSGHD